MKHLTLISSITLFSLLLIVYLVAFKRPKNLQGDEPILYKQVHNWPQLPGTLTLGNPTGLDLDTDQNLVVFHRGKREWPLLLPMPKTTIHENTILVLDHKTGKLIRSWGSGLFVMPHGLTIDKQNNVWVTDVGLHQIFKFNWEGKLILKLGEAGIAGCDALHFDKPTDIAVAADGSFYVADGYGNSRIVKFSASGKFILQWGKQGSRQGEFNIPHAIDVDAQGYVYVADRENRRVQVFTPNGVFIKAWSNADWGNICSITHDATRNGFIAVDDVTTLKVKHNGSDIISLDSAGNQLGKFGRSGLYNGPVNWYHDVSVDDDGNIYVGDILGNTLQKFKPVR